MIDVVEAAYSMEGDEHAWLARLATAALPALDRGLGVFAYIGEARTLRPVSFASARVPAAIERLIHDIGEHPPRGVDDSFVQHPMRFVAMSEVFLGDAVLRGHWERARSAQGYADGVGVYVHAARERSLHLFAVSTVRERPTQAERRAWLRVAVHLAAADRVRAQLAGRDPDERADAVLDASGRVHHATAAAASTDARDALRTAVRAMERARGLLRLQDGERALALWQGLVRGTWSLVDRWDTDGKRYIAAIPNPPTNLDPRALTPREGAAAKLAADGASAKEIAYALGVSASNARALLSAALTKLGLRTRADLYRWSPTSADVHVLPTSPPIHALAIPERDPSTWTPPADLTAAEVEVARLAALGRTNAEIARIRETSVRTVANQMATLLRKLGVASRADILRSTG